MTELREMHLSELLTILAEVPGDRADAFAMAIRKAQELELQAGLGPIANANLSRRVQGCEEALAQRDNLIAELRAQVAALCAEKLTPEVFTRVADWLKDPQRKPAATAFTSGMERQIAYALELDVLPHVKSMEMLAGRRPPAADLPADKRPLFDVQRHGKDKVSVMTRPSSNDGTGMAEHIIDKDTARRMLRQLQAIVGSADNTADQ